MKSLLCSVSIAMLFFLSGCGDSSVVNSPVAANPTHTASSSIQRYFHVTITIIQTTKGQDHVIVDDSFTTDHLSEGPQIDFNTLASPNGVSTFRIELGITWTNSANNWFGRYRISNNSPYQYDYHIFTNPAAGGSGSFTINNANLSEHSLYHYQLSADDI